jgi:hypothetical protein
MEFGYLHVRCGPYRILVPGDNVSSIDPLPEHGPARIPLHQARRQGWSLVLEARTLLGLEPAAPSPSRVIIHWHAVHNAVQAAVVVDGVEGLRGGYDAEFLPLPRVPPGFHDLFDRLVYDADGGFLLRLRQDVQPALDHTDSRRRFCRAVIGAVPPADQRHSG